MAIVRFKWIILVLLISAAFVALVSLYEIKCHEKYALLDAAEVDDLNKVKGLVDEGAPIDKIDPKLFGFTPLIGAIYHYNTNTAFYLIQAGADVNIPDKQGRTPLIWAIINGDKALPLVKYLIDHGASLDAKDKDGITVLGYAQSDPPKPRLVEVLEEAKLEHEKETNNNSAKDTNKN